MPMWATEKSEHVYTLKASSRWANTLCMRGCGRLLLAGQGVMDNDAIICHLECA